MLLYFRTDTILLVHFKHGDMRMKAQYVSPALDLQAFNCPKCHVFSKQKWYFMSGAESSDGFGLQIQDQRFLISSCEHCHFPTIWFGQQIIFPLQTTAEPPNLDLPDDIMKDYEEARAISNLSPRGAAALLRLAIQKLCKHLGQPGDNINSDVKALVAKGLPPLVQEALDSVRVIGNEAVHPGTLDLRDDRELASKLFRLVNFIANKMITEPREISEIYGSLPPDKREGIKKRDAK
jgi:predicted nucleic-acid-binding Zn-ribbon protein